METKERGRIVNDGRGMGGFLDPPNHPHHTTWVESDLRRRPDNRSAQSLQSASESEWLDDETRDRARKILAEYTPPALDSEETQDWIAQVLGYFRNCYQSAEGWNASDLIIDADRDPVANADTHAGVHLIRKTYPDWTPTRNDFTRAYWGKRA